MREVDKALFDKYEVLLAELRSYGSAAIAFSGGVDSTFLLYAAKEALGEKLVAVTAASGSFPVREFREAEDYCKDINVRQIVVKIEEMKIPHFTENPSNRCYLCKHTIFSKFLETAAAESLAVVAEGSNVDDDGDYRPGHVAIAELKIKSPLRKAGFTKEEIRILSKEFGLPTWEKPAFACLATRFPYGETITSEKLHMVEQGEELLRELGFHQYRVRIHGNLARIEVLPEEQDRFLASDMRSKIHEAFQSYGFAYVAMDLKGYRIGSMNETLSQQEMDKVLRR